MSLYTRPSKLTAEQKKKGIKQKYYIRIRVPTNEHDSKGRKKYINHFWSAGNKGEVSKKYLEERCKELKRKYLGHKVFENTKEPPSIEAFSTKYISYKRDVEKKRSTNRMKIVLDRLIKFYGPDHLISEISVVSVDNYKRQRLDEGVKAATINRELSILRSMLNMAIKWEYINLWNDFKGMNPVSKAGLLTDLERQERKKKFPPTDAEINRLLFLLPLEIRRICINQLQTGMRITETLNLKKDNLKVLGKHKIIYLDASQVKEKKDKIIPLNPTAKENIDDALTKNKSEYVFLNSEGKHYGDYRRINEALEKACKKLGINKITSHMLRSKFSSKSVDEGANPYAISKLLGHSSIKVTDEHYITLDKSLLEAVNFANYE